VFGAASCPVEITGISCYANVNIYACEGDPDTCVDSYEEYIDCECIYVPAEGFCDDMSPCPPVDVVIISEITASVVCMVVGLDYTITVNYENTETSSTTSVTASFTASSTEDDIVFDGPTPTATEMWWQLVDYSIELT
jgi:hypothetical protein